MTRRLLPILAAAALAAAALAAAAAALSLPERTFRASVGINASDPDGASTRPSLSDDGQRVVFDSTATNLDADPNGAQRDVFVRDLPRARTLLVSESFDGAGGNGPSSQATIAGTTVAFVSTASNLVAGDANGHDDVFLRAGNGPVRRISVPGPGLEADGDSSDPDISSDARFVAFVSTATNLAAGDANGAEDVFVHDVRTGGIERISEVSGRAAAGRSRRPAISADGRFVTFASTAADLVEGDTNDAEDVFVYDRTTRRTERVSVSSTEDEQNAAVAAPFSQVSDISRTGRYVVFDSDATNLVPNDTNQDTDVFLRDRALDRTTRVSVDSLGQEADNDSYFPSIGSDGKSVAFSSFAGDLAPDDHPKEDVFVRDLATETTLLAGVSARGRTRADEHVPQLLQRPAVSSGGDVVAFTSTAGNLVAGDGNRREDVFVRITTPPRARFTHRPRAIERVARPVFRVDIDDPNADRLLCTIDGRPFLCDERSRVPAVGDGTHVLRVRAAGPGMRFESRGITARFRVVGVGKRARPAVRPSVRITHPRTRTFNDRVEGRASGGAGVERVEVLVNVQNRNGCYFFNGTEFEKRPCTKRLFVIADGTTRWRVLLTRSAPKGAVFVLARAVDRDGNRSKQAIKASISR